MTKQIYKMDIGELVYLNSKIATLRSAVWDAPCLVARPNEMTYECRHDNKCVVCEWRQKVDKEFRALYNEPL